MNDETWNQAFARAQHLIGVHRAPDALPILADLIAAQPNSIATRHLLIQALRDTGDTQSALRETRAALELDSENVDSLYWLALLAKRFKERKNAIRKAILIAPEDAELHALHGYVLGSARPGVALPLPFEKQIEAAARKALELNPKSVAGLMVLTDSLKTQWRLKEAEEVATHWLELAPNDPDALRAFALIQTLLHPYDTEDTEGDLLRESLRNDPTSKASQFHLRMSQQRFQNNTFIADIYDVVFGWIPPLLQLPIVLPLAVFLIYGYSTQPEPTGHPKPLIGSFLLALVLLIPAGFIVSLALRPYREKWPHLFGRKTR